MEPLREGAWLAWPDLRPSRLMRGGYGVESHVILGGKNRKAGGGKRKAAAVQRKGDKKAFKFI